MKRRLITLLLPLLGCTLLSARPSTLDSLLSVYETEVKQSAVYIDARQHRIDSLCALRPMTEALQMQIAQEYHPFQSDSALAWYMKLRQASEPYHRQALTGAVRLLGSAGHYSSAINLLHSDEAPALQSSGDYKMAWLLYREAAAAAKLPSMQAELARTSQHYYKSMMNALAHEQDSMESSRLEYNLYRASERGDYTAALQYSEQLLRGISPSEHQYAILAYGHAMLYEQAGYREKRNEWLVRSAIVDVRLGIRDNGSAWMVAQECYEAGDIQMAYTLMNYSLTNAASFNAPTRFIQTYALGHHIDTDYDLRLQQSNTRLAILLGLLTAMMAVILIIVLYAFRQKRKLRAQNIEMKAVNERLNETNRQLKASNLVKEQYICRYLEVYSDYIRRLTTMARKAGEKDSAAFMDREMDNFYRSFDDTFLSLYGTFVQDFNALLKPEARITPKPGERMTVEMRIFALILLGITSSAKIAELLCYSPNTISNYRVKVKNGALGDRDTFEQRVQQIGK